MNTPSTKPQQNRDNGASTDQPERVIRVLVVDDEPLMAAVTAAVLESEVDLTVTGIVGSAASALGQVHRNADIVLISASLPDGGALRLVERLADSGHESYTVVTGLGLSEQEVIAYVEAGAAAYVLKESSVDDLVNTVRAAASGAALASPEIIRALMARVADLVRLCAEAGIEVDGLPRLTEREEQVLRLISRGKSNPEIAAEFNLTVGTVKQHVHNILRKLNVSNRKDAARYFRMMTTLGVPEDL